MLDAIDILVPFKSGEKFRVLRHSRQYIYNKYMEIGLQRASPIVSPSYFYSTLNQDNIHFKPQLSLCPYCLELQKLKSKGVLCLGEHLRQSELELHWQRSHTRVNESKQDKASLNAGLLLSTVIVYQDFSQLKLQKGTILQELILVWYELYNNQPGKMVSHVVRVISDDGKSEIKEASKRKRKIDNLVKQYNKKHKKTNKTGNLESHPDEVHAEATDERAQTNDNRFVISVWSNLLKFFSQKGISQIIIWSDGGRKHFKQSAMLYFWSISQVTIFFLSLL